MTVATAPAARQYPTTTGGRLLIVGRTYDYECSRTTNRLQTARRILTEMGIAPTTTHGTQTAWDWATNRETHVCGEHHGCVTTWSGNPAPADFDAAYDLAHEEISNRRR